MNEMKSTEPTKLIEHLGEGREVRRAEDARRLFPQAYDHQMMHEMYAVEALKATEMKNQWDIYNALGAVPGAERAPRGHRATPKRTSAT